MTPIKTPTTPAEYLSLLNLALSMASDLSESLNVGAEEGASSLQSLRELTLDEKMALGDKACNDLQSLAFAAAPSLVLDGLEAQLAEHSPSKDESYQLLARLRKGV